MRLTVTFGMRDIAAVGFAISPMQHLAFGVQVGAGPPSPTMRWWRSVCQRVPAAAMPLIDLFLADPWYLPEFLTPPIPLTSGNRYGSIDEELDAVRAVGTEQLQGELRHYFDRPGAVPRTVQVLADGSDRQIARLTDVARAFYQGCLADDWPAMVRRLRADIDRRRATLGSEGLAAMLSGIRPAWRDPSTFTMIIPAPAESFPTDLTFALDGSGFLLSPNLFLGGQFAPMLSPFQRPVFAYTAAVETTGPAGRVDGLVGLLGRGRAAALRCVEEGCTTADLAGRMRVSAPTASVHAATLRSAGLVTTTRDGRRVLHTVTVLGAELLAANPVPHLEAAVQA